MHGTQQPVPAISAAASADPAQRLTAVVPLARRDDQKRERSALDVTGTDTPGRDLAVQYSLDRDSHRWVAALVDEATRLIVRYLQ